MEKGYVVKHAAGGFVWLSPIYPQKGPNKVIGVMDISEDLYLHLLDHAPYAYLYGDLGSRQDGVNPIAHELFEAAKIAKVLYGEVGE